MSEKPSDPKSKPSRRRARKIKVLETYERTVILMSKRKYKDALEELEKLTSNKAIKPWMHIACLLKITDCIIHLSKNYSHITFVQQHKQLFKMLFEVMDIKPKLVYIAANDIMESNSRLLQSALLFDCAAYLYIKKGAKKKAWKGVLSCVNGLYSVAWKMIDNQNGPSQFVKKSVKIIMYEQTHVYAELVKERRSKKNIAKYSQSFKQTINETQDIAEAFFKKQPLEVRKNTNYPVVISEDSQANANQQHSLKEHQLSVKENPSKFSDHVSPTSTRSTIPLEDERDALSLESIQVSSEVGMHVLESEKASPFSYDENSQKSRRSSRRSRSARDNISISSSRDRRRRKTPQPTATSHFVETDEPTTADSARSNQFQENIMDNHSTLCLPQWITKPATNSEEALTKHESNINIRKETPTPLKYLEGPITTV